MMAKENPPAVAAAGGNSQRIEEKRQPQEDYTMKEWIKTSAVILILAAEIIFGIHMYLEEERANRAVWTEEIPIANQHIEWTGAGYGRVSE